MKKTLLSFFIILSLVYAPVAHALQAIDPCHAPYDGQQQETAKTVKDKDVNDKIDKAAHHCCCTHASAHVSAPLYVPTSSSTLPAFYSKNAFHRSHVVGLPLKPPSQL